MSEAIKHQSDMRGLLITGLILAEGIAVGLLRQSYFPAGVFAIGQGASDHNRREVIRLTVIGFVASLVAGAIFMIHILP